MSISTPKKNGSRNFRRSPSSIISVDSDIRFTRKKLTSQYRCGCCIIASFLIFLLLASIAVYFGYDYIISEPEKQIFRASFRIVEGDVFTSELADPNNTKFKSTSRDYREKLNLLFRRSPIRSGFIGTEILALDGTEDKDLIIHFNIHIDPSWTRVNSKDLEDIFLNDLKVQTHLFKNITIEPSSLQIKPSNVVPQASTTLPSTADYQAVTTPPTEPRSCQPAQLNYCQLINPNTTSYPNVVGHKSYHETNDNLISFREIVDAECYKYAFEFVCHLLQPFCQRKEDEFDIQLPCKSYCKSFMNGCGGRLPEKIKSLLDCSRFPEYGSEDDCLVEPGCIKNLGVQALSSRVCDGVVDCEDASDEKNCKYCPKNYIHCGIGRSCIKPNKVCDGTKDCPDGSDETSCLSLSITIGKKRNRKFLTPHLNYIARGYVTYNDKGEIGKICAENLGRISKNTTSPVLYTIASSLCRSLTYRNVLLVEIDEDSEHDIPYVKIVNPFAKELTFMRTYCTSKKVLKIHCKEIECGIQRTHGPSALNVLPKIAHHGDWPWHAALYKENIHLCDGSLIASTWVATTASCFQGQPRAEWTAKFGTVRSHGMAPWQQERRIVGMVKSPVEGSTVALVKLEKMVAFSDFVRPICLSRRRISAKNECNTLGWTEVGEHLQRVQIRVTNMEKCENISISTVNGMCTELAYGRKDCNEEEYAGSPVMCLDETSTRWNLAGLTNWRIACAKNGMERPRMYDKIDSNVPWILETIGL